MEQEEKVAVLLEQQKDGGITKREITREELNRLFFHEGNRTWDNIHRVLPEPVWEQLREDGRLVYEGYTVDHKAFGAGRCFYPDGTVCAEGIFGLKGLLCGREYYPNGNIRFEGCFRLNQAYGPNYPDYGTWYGKDGELLFRGKFSVSRSSVGLPIPEEPKGFDWMRHSPAGKGTFIWDDARKYMKQEESDGQGPAGTGEEEQDDDL